MTRSGHFNSVNKKELKRREREAAGLGAKAREESEARQKIIAELFLAVEGLECRKEQPGEGTLVVARELVQQWTFKKRPVFQGLLDNKRLLLLVALVEALKRDHEFLNLIRQHKPEELEDLWHESHWAWLRELIPGLFEGKLTYEGKRRLLNRIGEIERLFGSQPPPSFALATAPLPPPRHDIPDRWFFKPPGIDVILGGETLNMVELQDLFGISRRQLRWYLNGMPPVRKGRETRYDYLHVLQIMYTALKEKRPKGKKSAKGRPRRFWPADAEKRERLLEAIVNHALSIGAPEEIVLGLKAIAIVFSGHNSGQK